MRTAEQLRMDDVASATAGGHFRASAGLSPQLLRDFRRILDSWIATGEVFTSDDMREQLDLAQIPNSSRGTLIRNAHAAHLIDFLGWRRSTHVATHGKPIACWRKPLDERPPADDPSAGAP